MITVNNKQFRNLEEQVRKNKEDIATHYEIDRVLSDWGIKVLGVYASADLLPTENNEYGDAYGVGATEPYTYYIWTRANSNVGQETDYWLNVGALSIVGPQGPQGEQGEQGIQGVRGSNWTSHSNFPTASQPGNVGDQWLETRTGDIYQKGTSTWTKTGNIKGPQGAQGLVGPQGIQGIQGPIGPQGVKGDTGSSFQIAGLLASTDLLPTPTEANRHKAYAIGNSTDGYDLYVITGEEELLWVNMGRIEGVEGPQGPVGPQGPAGADIQVVHITGIPAESTQGTLTTEQVNTLLAHPSNYIQFLNENFYPQDVETESGYIVYSHVGSLDDVIKIKTIVLTIATGGWVLTTTTLNEEDANASNAMIFNNVVVNSNLTSSEDKANWTKLMNDTLNDQAIYPVYINGRRVWFVKVSETDSYGFWINGTEKKTLYNREYPTTSLVFQYYCISNAHSSYRYKFLRGGNFFYASDSYWEPTAIVEWLAQNEGFHILQLNASSNTGWTGKYGDVSLSIYNGQGKTKYDNATYQGGYIDGFSATLWSSRTSGQKTYFRIISPDEVDEKIAAAIDGALEENY